jgi:hypothetical protein
MALLLWVLAGREACPEPDSGSPAPATKKLRLSDNGSLFFVIIFAPARILSCGLYTDIFLQLKAVKATILKNYLTLFYEQEL